MPGAGRIKWTYDQIERLRKAIVAYNRVIDTLDTRMEYGEYDLVPSKTTLAKEMGRIGTRQELYQRERRLRRIARDDQQLPVDYYGNEVPRYLAEQMEMEKRDVNDARKKAREGNYDWDNMDEVERATAKARGNIGELEGEYRTPEDLQNLIDMHYAETDASYMEQYIAEWQRYCVIREYEQEVIDNINWLVDNKPDALRRILERGYIQALIEYIYPVSSDMSLDVYSRHKNIVEFWREAKTGRF